MSVARSSHSRHPQVREHFVLFGMIALVLLIDAVTPLGVASWLLYVVPIWFATRVRDGGYWAAVASLVCSILIGVGYFLSPPPEFPAWMAILNRGLGIALLWLTSAILVRASQRKAALQKQAILLAEHALLLDRAHVLVRGLDGRIITWTRGLSQLYGWAKHEALGRVTHDLLETRFAVPLERADAELLRTGEWSGELTQSRRDGSKVVVASHWVLHLDPAGGPSAVLEINNDITELKRTQEALRESQERLEVALDAAALGTWDVDLATGELLESYQRSCMFGLPPGISNRSLAEWGSRVHPDDAPRVLTEFRGASHSGAEYEVEYRVVWADGSIHWIASKGTVLKNDEGKPVRAIGVSYDITPRKVAEEEIRRLLKEAESRERELREKQDQLVQTAKLAGLGELATGVAHELNNPLNNIGLFIGNALDRVRLGLPDPGVIALELERSLAQVKKAATIITHLRTFGRMAPQEREPVALNELVTNALSLVQEQFRLCGIEMQIDLSPADPRTLGNRIQLEQVFVNLLTNARDAVEAVEHKAITIHTAVYGEQAVVEVRDTGQGIPATEQSRIFDPFFTTKEVGQGTGLGLSIAYGIVKEHNGQIAVDSRPGHGAAFRIVLPMLRTHAA